MSKRIVFMGAGGGGGYVGGHLARKGDAAALEEVEGAILAASKRATEEGRPSTGQDIVTRISLPGYRYQDIVTRISLKDAARRSIILMASSRQEGTKWAFRHRRIRH